MGIAAIKIKIMPESPDVDLKALEKQVEQMILDLGGKNPKTETEPVAFGLNAVIVLFAWEEEEPTDDLLDKLREIPGANSAEIIDFRRAFG